MSNRFACSLPPSLPLRTANDFHGPASTVGRRATADGRRNTLAGKGSAGETEIYSKRCRQSSFVRIGSLDISRGVTFSPPFAIMYVCTVGSIVP